MSVAVTSDAPSATAAATRHNPIGPDPVTSTFWPSTPPAIRIACSATASGSARDASRSDNPSGSSRIMKSLASRYSLIPPWVCGVVDALPK